MSIPQIRTEAIEAVGRKILMEYDPSLLSGQPCPVPIETIIETKFDLILEFHTLSKNPKILGETIFDDGAVVLYDQIQRQYRMIAVRAGTILIDERLCDPSKLGRLRFTCAHELAHWVLHKKLYPALQHPHQKAQQQTEQLQRREPRRCKARRFQFAHIRCPHPRTH